MSRRLLISTLLALSAAAISSNAHAASTLTPAGTVITNVGQFDYIDDSGVSQTLSSTPVTLTVTQIAAISVSPHGTTITPGQTVYAAPNAMGMLTYAVQNDGNGPDTAVITTLDGNGAAMNGVTYYYDATRTQPVPASGVPLTAGQARTIYAFYTLPSTASGGSATLIDPVGTSAFNPSKFDNGNYGRIVTQNVHSVTVTGNNTLSTTSPGSVSGTHTLTNTGNAPIDRSTAGSVTLSTTTTDPNLALSGFSYQFGSTPSTSGTTIAAAFNNYLAANPDGLPAGASVNYTTTYTTASGKTAGQTATSSDRSSFTQTGSATDAYPTSATPGSSNDQITILSGQAVITKTGDNCGSDATCATPTLNTSSGKPGDYVRYTITARNSGTAPLKAPVLHDTLNTYLNFISLTASTTQTTANTKLVYSTDGSTYTAAAPTTLSATRTLYVGQDSTANTARPTVNDTLDPSQTITVVILTRIQ